jgi:flagellar basal-body rod modification protein FlgD
MMVTPGSAAAQPAMPFTSQPGGNLGKEEFLQLLVAQIRHQDPLNPLEGSEFASQLAHFASLEQLVQVNDRLSAQLMLNEAMIHAFNTTAALDVVGHSVLSSGSHVVVDEGVDAAVEFDVLGNGAAGTLRILDGSGREVARRDLGPLGPGRHTVPLDELTGGLEPGVYSFAVDITDTKGVPVAVRTYTLARITGVRYGEAGPVLLAGQLEVSLGDITEVRWNR